jgi:hypothetical protein
MFDVRALIVLRNQMTACFSRADLNVRGQTGTSSDEQGRCAGNSACSDKAIIAVWSIDDVLVGRSRKHANATTQVNPVPAIGMGRSIRPVTDGGDAV